MKFIPTCIAILILSIHGLASEEFKLAKEAASVYKAVLSLQTIGEMTPFTDKDDKPTLRRFFKSKNLLRIVYSSDFRKAGESRAYSFKNKPTPYRANVIFDIERISETETRLRVTLDGYQIETGRGFSIHSLLSDAVKTRPVASTGVDERYLISLVAAKLTVPFPAEKVLPINLN